MTNSDVIYCIFPVRLGDSAPPVMQNGVRSGVSG